MATAINNTAPAFVNRIGYSDIEPFEVVRVISSKTIEARRMKAVQDPSWKPVCIPGGFFAHCTNNNTQRWVITSDESEDVIRLHLRKDGKYYCNGEKYSPATEPKKFYDFNF